MRETAGSAAAPAARCKNLRRGSFILNPPFTSFDHLVSAGEQRRRHFQAERLCSRQIDDEIEFGRLLDRKVGWLRPTQNLVDKVASTPEQIWEVWSIGHQAARFDVVPRPVHRR